MSFWLAVLVLLVAAALRLWLLSGLPPGLSDAEITDLRIVETIRQGRIEVFYNLGTEGREGLYHTLLAASTLLTGGGMVGYHVVAVWAGMILLALVYALTTRLYGPLPGVAALLVLVPNLWAILLARSVGREVLVPLLVAGALLAIARAFPVYHHDRSTRPPDTRPFAAMGVVLALSFYTHPVGFPMTLFSVAFIAYLLLSRQPMPRKVLNYTWFGLLVLVILTMPYLISTLRNPTLGGAGRLLDGGAALQNVLNSLGGIFLYGDTNPAHNLPGRPLLDVVSGLVVVVGLVSAVRYWRLPRFALPLVALAALAPAALLAGSGFPGYAALLPLVAVLFAAGVRTVYSSLPRRVQSWGMAVLWLLFAVNVVWVVNDLFFVWRQLPAVQRAYHADLRALAHHADVTADDVPTVVCAPNIDPFAPSSAPLSTTQLMLTMMHGANDRRLRFADCRAGLVIADGGARQQLILSDLRMRDGMHPAIRAWVDRGVPLDAPGVPPGSVLILDVAGPLADMIGLFTTTTPVSYAPDAPGGSATVPPPVQFGGNLTLLGYQRDNAVTYRPDSIMTLQTYWRVDGAVPPDVRFFTHVLSDPAAIVTQIDTINVLTEHLQPRDVLLQITYVPMPLTIPAGAYQVSIGAYQLSDETRLTVFDANLQPRGNRLFLDPITVETSP